MFPKFIFSSLLLLLGWLPPLIGLQAQQTFTISGYIREAGSNKTLAGATVQTGRGTGFVANSYGYYAGSVAAGEPLKLVYRSLGYKPQVLELVWHQDTVIHVQLHPESAEMAAAVVEAAQEENILSTPQMSRTVVPIQKICELPAFMTEKDALKVLQLLPGVQNGREGSSGLFVRGGS